MLDKEDRRKVLDASTAGVTWGAVGGAFGGAIAVLILFAEWTSVALASAGLLLSVWRIQQAGDRFATALWWDIHPENPDSILKQAVRQKAVATQETDT